MIDDRERAERFARAILADLALYNSSKLESSRDPLSELSAEIQEGRDLFRKRVAPALHGCFEAALTAWARERRSAKPDPDAHRQTEQRDAQLARQREADEALTQAAASEAQAERRSMFVVTAGIGSFVMFVAAGVAVYEEEKHEKRDKHETAHDDKYTPSAPSVPTAVVNAPKPAAVTIPSCICNYGNNRTTPRIDVSFRAPPTNNAGPWVMHVVSRPLGSRRNVEESDFPLMASDATALFPPTEKGSVTYGLACDLGYVVFASGTAVNGWNDDTGVLSWRATLASPIALPTDAGAPQSLAPGSSDYDVRCIALLTEGGELPLVLQNGKRVSIALSTGKVR
jgi:hypothetical protein